MLLVVLHVVIGKLIKPQKQITDHIDMLEGWLLIVFTEQVEYTM